MVSKKKDQKSDDDWDDFERPDLSKYDDWEEDDKPKKKSKTVSKVKSKEDDDDDWDDYNYPDLSKYEEWKEDGESEEDEEEDPYNWDDFERPDLDKYKKYQTDNFYDAHVIWTNETLLEKAKETHGDEYDYSKWNYKGREDTKVTIICPEHGEFVQDAISHARDGKNCPKCAYRMRDRPDGLDAPSRRQKSRKKQEDIINQFREVHGDRYDYSKVNYQTMNHKVIIICKIHGEFQQYPYVHRRGSGCKQCATDEKAKSQMTPLKEVLKQFKRVHGDTYDYSKVDPTAKKFTIICRKHGEFKQSRTSHIKYRTPCPICRKDVPQTNQFSSESYREKLFKKVIEEFRNIRGGKYDYDYSKSIFVNLSTPMKIICKEHGEFFQKPRHHRKGSIVCKGCLGGRKFVRF